MKDILDFDHEIKPNQEISNLSKVISLSALIIMFVGGILYVKYGLVSGKKATTLQLLIASFGFMAITIGTSIFLDLVSRIFIRKNRSKIFLMEFMLKNINFGFVIWLVLNLLVVFDKYFS